MHPRSAKTPLCCRFNWRGSFARTGDTIKTSSAVFGAEALTEVGKGLLVLRLEREGERGIPAGMATEAVAAAPCAAAAICRGFFSQEVCHAPRVSPAAAEERAEPLAGWGRA